MRFRTLNYASSRFAMMSFFEAAFCVKHYTTLIVVDLQRIFSFNSLKFYTLKSRLQLFFALDVTACNRPRHPHYHVFTITLRHTTLGRIPLYE